MKRRRSYIAHCVAQQFITFQRGGGAGATQLQSNHDTFLPTEPPPSQNRPSLFSLFSSFWILHMNCIPPPECHINSLVSMVVCGFLFSVVTVPLLWVTQFLWCCLFLFHLVSILVPSLDWKFEEFVPDVSFIIFHLFFLIPPPQIGCSF